MSEPPLPDFAASVQRNLRYSLGKRWQDASPRDLFTAVSLATRESLIEQMLATEERYRAADAKRLYYLSVEFLMGRSLGNNLLNLGMLDPVARDPGHARRGPRGAARAGARRRARQRRPRPAGRLLPRLARQPRHARLRLRHQLRARPVPAGDRGRSAARVPRQLARPGLAVADHAPRRDPARARVRRGREARRRRRPRADALDPPADHARRAARPADRLLRRAHRELAAALLGARLRRVRHRHLPPGRLPRAPSSRSSSPSASRRCSTRPSRRARARSCGSCRSTSSWRARCATSWRATSPPAATFDSFPDKVAIQLNDTHPALAVAELVRLLRRRPRAAVREGVRVRPADLRATPITRSCPRRWSAGRKPLLQRVVPRHLQIIELINARLPGRGRGALAGRHREAAQPVDHRGGSPAAGAHGAPRDRRQPRRERRLEAPLRPGEDGPRARLRRALARALPEQDERGLAAALADEGEPRAVRPDHRAASATAGSATSRRCASSSRTLPIPSSSAPSAT